MHFHIKGIRTRDESSPVFFGAKWPPSLQTFCMRRGEQRAKTWIGSAKERARKAAFKVKLRLVATRCNIGMFLGVPSPFFPGILLSKKPPKTLEKQLFFEKNDS